MTADGPFGRDAILRAIPHREPFLFLDEVLTVTRGETAVGRWTVRGDEPFLAGHFPGRPIVPGALLLEHMAQTACFLLARGRDPDRPPKTGTVVFGLVRNARFLAPVTPPADIRTEVTAVTLHAARGIVEAVSRIGGDAVASARLQFGTIG